MRTLQQAIDKMDNKGGAGASLRKHLNAVGIKTWDDINRDSLFEFHDVLCDAVAASTAKTVAAYFKALLHRHKHQLDLPEDWEEILIVKGDVSRSTYLTPDELKAFEAVEAKTPKERIVQVEFLIEAYTGARISDVMTFDENSYEGDYLTYTSQKTMVTATVPISEKTKGWIAYAQEHREDEPTLAGRDIIIKRMARRAGIDEMVKTRRGGVDRVTPKWQVLSSHCGRRSTATNLVAAGASINDAKLCLGHTSTATTERYICNYAPKLTKEALDFFSN